MKTLLAMMLLVTLPAFATVSVKRSQEKPKTLNVEIADEPLSSAVKALTMYLPHRVQLLIGEDKHVTYSAKQNAPEAALRGVVETAGATLTLEHEQYWVRNFREPSVTLDVKDQDVRLILKNMQKQCGIKNVVIDPDVSGTGTFLFEDLPCRTAFNVVLRSTGLAAMEYSNSLVEVGRRH